MFGIDDKILMDPNYIKILNGIAGSGKSTSTVNDLRKIGSNFCLASFSNALKFAAIDKFGCPADTICGLAFVNTPFPRYDEKDVEGFDTVVLDEILLDGVECITWMVNHVGKVNIIALTDSRQMLNADNGRASLKAFDELCGRDDVVCVEIDKTKRARDKETVKVYEKLYAMDSNVLLNVDQVQKLFKCDIVDMKNVTFDENNTYLCHSNAIEHEIYKMYGLSDRKDIKLIPKNHISRNKTFDVNKYPICDQITADSKRVDSYLQAANVATPTRFQGKEVVVGDECYFVCKKDDIFTGREIYTVGTRCQSIKSIHIAIIEIPEYKDPVRIAGKPVGKAKRLNLPEHDKQYKCVSMNKMTQLLKQYGEEGETYLCDMILSNENVIYSTMPSTELSKFAKFENGEVKLNKVIHMAKKTIRSMVKRDTTMHFDYMAKVYELAGIEITPPRINNPRLCNKKDFGKLCDIYSAFPTILNFATMPKAGYIYEKYDPNLLNWYIYTGDRVSKWSLITEELANKLGDSKYVFSTDKQVGCEIGRYTYEQCKKSKDKKKKVNQDFLWGKLESGYYTMTDVVTDGVHEKKYIKHTNNNLELVACALWSKLCLIMLDAVDSIDATEFFVITDGLYYNGDKDPVIPDWCDYRIEEKHWDEEHDDDEKYHNVIKKSYEDPKSAKEIKREKQRARRAAMTPEQKAAEAERSRQRRANMTDEQRAAEAERKRIARAQKRGDK